MHYAIRLLTMVGLLFWQPAMGMAVELGPVSVNGFISQGYIDSSDNNFLADTVGGTTQFNEIGLTFNSQVSDQLKVGAQFLSRDLGEVGDNEVRLDWGYGDYRFNDYVGIRLGKVKLPMGLYNEGRDTDFLRPMIFLPQSIYDESKRDLLVAYQGGGLYGNLPLGKAGDLVYHGFYGTINFNDDSLLVDAVEQNATSTIRKNLRPVLVPALAPQYLPDHAPPFSPVEQAEAVTKAQQYVSTLDIVDFDLENDYVTGGSLVWNAPVDGLRLGLSYLKVKNDIDLTLNKSIDPTVDVFNPSEVFQQTDMTGSLENKSTVVVSAEYTIGGLVIAGEYSETDREQLYEGYVGVDATSQSYYGQLSYTVWDKLTLSMLYDVYYFDKNDKDGKDFVAAGFGPRQDFCSWRKDFGIGLRYDPNPNFTLKAEFHDVNGAGLSMTVVNPTGELKESWNYYALKASFNF